MTTNSTTVEPISRSPSPKGCNKPLMTHLTQQERRQLERIASQEMRSLSATARLLIVQGMQQHQAATDAGAQES
jgi:hypothetical protein